MDGSTGPGREVTRNQEGRDAEITDAQARALSHERRQEIMDALSQTPGLNKNQISGRLGVDPNLVEFHLDRLETHDLVVQRPSAQGQETLCFRTEDAHLWEDEDTRILFGRRRTREIGLYLAEHHGASSDELAEAFDLTPVTIRYHLRTLGDHGLVEQLRFGRSVEYHAREKLEAWARDIGEPFERPWASDE